MKKAKDLTMFCLLKMSKQVKIPNKILYESFLIGVLYLVGTLSLYEDVIRRGRPVCVSNYSDGAIIHHKIMDEISK